jgi:hypothetical protein
VKGGELCGRCLAVYALSERKEQTTERILLKKLGTSEKRITFLRKILRYRE